MAHHYYCYQLGARIAKCRGVPLHIFKRISATFVWFSRMERRHRSVGRTCFSHVFTFMDLSAQTKKILLPYRENYIDFYDSWKNTAMSNNKSWSALTFETPFIQLFTPSLRVHMFRIGWKKYSDEVSEPSCGHYNIYLFFRQKRIFSQ